jgi:two-component system, response regulator YesN
MRNHYTILLVDDEDETRGRIASLIDRQSGFEVIGKAGNGHDAYELVEQLRPDVVLTDIRMPFIDGIELARMLKRDYPTVKVAFISGHDEFKYAQEAIRLNVISYLMKPLTSSDIDAFLHELKKRLDEEHQRKFSITHHMEHYDDVRPFMVNHHIQRLVMPDTDASEHVSRLEALGVDTSGGRYALALVEIETSDDDNDLVAMEKIRVLLSEIMADTFKDHTFARHLMFQDAFMVIVRESQESLMHQMDAFLYELLQTAELYMDIRIRAGVSKPVRTLKDIREAYKDAKKAINDSRFLNIGRIAYITDIEDKETRTLSLDPDDIKAIEHAIRFSDQTTIHTLFTSVRNRFADKPDQLVSIQHLVIALANIILSFKASTDADAPDIPGERFIETMLGFTDVREVFDWTEDVLLKLRGSVIRNNLTRAETILRDALAYVDRNHQDSSLSLNKVCDALGVSISYLSMLMKREKSMTFNTYVIRVRMEKARMLLETTQDKIIDIARECGYNDVYYFSHSFKKHTGESPKKYRENSHV